MLFYTTYIEMKKNDDLITMASELAKVGNVMTSKVAFTKNLLKNITVKTIHESTKINNGNLCR